MKNTKHVGSITEHSIMEVKNCKRIELIELSTDLM